MAGSSGWKILNLNGLDDGLQINQNWIRKKIDEVKKDDDGTIAILTEQQGLKTRLRTKQHHDLCCQWNKLVCKIILKEKCWKS